MLFVGESPPAGGRFFYREDSMLFRETRETFCAVFGERLRESFLEHFKRLGCYLDDLCSEPVNRKERAARRSAHRDGIAHLGKTLSQLQPRAIVVLLKSIESSVEQAAVAAGCEGVERHVVTYPSRWHAHRVAYREELTKVLRDFLERGVF